jgi:diaminopimelate epimerase
MKITTHLISGAANTFHIVNESLSDKFQSPQTEGWSTAQKKSFAKKICESHVADGFIYLKKSPDFVGITWDFYNKDGSDAEMCGNATRCVGLYLAEVLKINVIAPDPEEKTQYETKKKPPKKDPAIWDLQTTAGPIHIEQVSEGQYKINMTEIKILQSTKGFFCDTGVPHLVQEIKDTVDFKKHKDEARQLRYDPEFQPRGTNVTFVQLTPDRQYVKAISYERGVEDFTEACGTGAMAAAAYNLTKRGVSETQVEMPGGILKMSLADLKHPVMIGPAKLLGKYEYENPA